MFNETIKGLQLQKRLTLRDFCAQSGLDPSNWSKVGTARGHELTDPELARAAQSLLWKTGD